MTGFGQASGENDRYRITVTLRGVNHRFLDLSLRLRDDQRQLEPELREALKSRLWRGRVEIGLETEGIGERPVDLVVEAEVVRALSTLAADLKRRGLVSTELGFGDLLRLPQIVRVQQGDPQWQKEDCELLGEVVHRALDQLIDARLTEGQNLSVVLKERIFRLRQVTAELRKLGEELPAIMALKLRQRIRELVAEEIADESRLAQESALLADRSDVTEELDRLAAHLDHFLEVLEQEGSVGKRLDFLTQEIFRELNTVGTKCRDSKMTRLVLDGKTLCEQVREQVQNVE